MVLSPSSPKGRAGTAVHAIRFARSPEADFEVGGRRYAVFAHDWRVDPIERWIEVKSALDPTRGDRRRVRRQLDVLSEPDFEAAVRQALRDLHRPALGSNPLLRSRLAYAHARGAADAGDAARADARGRRRVARGIRRRADKLYRALDCTYLSPAATQELAAERLGLPFNTYRYQLGGSGQARRPTTLWQRELQADYALSLNSAAFRLLFRHLPRRPSASMHPPDYDAIVVGARCAGASTAMLLARHGHRVLLVDRAHFPSEIPQGHFVHRHGPPRLASWGLLDQVVASGCPPVTTSPLTSGDFPLRCKQPAAATGWPGATVRAAPCSTRSCVDAARRGRRRAREGLAVDGLLIAGRPRHRHPHGERQRAITAPADDRRGRQALARRARRSCGRVRGGAHAGVLVLHVFPRRA